MLATSAGAGPTLRVPVAPPLRAGLVAPQIRARVGEAGELAQLGDVARRLVRLVGPRLPHGLVRTDHAEAHAATLPMSFKATYGLSS